MTFSWDKDWYRLYDFLGIRAFMDFIGSSGIQDALFPIKLVFIIFAVFFLCAVIYFYLNSSYLRYQFLQDVSEFFSWQAYGLREVNKRWKDITERITIGSEKEYKLAVVHADDFLYQELQDAEFQGSTFEEMVKSAGRRLLPNWQDILQAHKIRNDIVYNVDYKLDINTAKKILDDYEKAIKSIYSY